MSLTDDIRHLPLGHRRRAALVALALAGVLVGGLIGLFTISGTKMRTIYARFSETPGLYKGDHVDVLGMPIGSVSKITPSPNGVTVKMEVASSTKIPEGAAAEIQAPNIVSDRYIQLTPTYDPKSSNPNLSKEMSSGYTIPMQRTLVPISVDQILDEVNMLATALGPNGANRNGAVTAALNQLNQTFGSQGKNVHDIVTGAGNALQGLQGDGPAITGLLNNLGDFTTAAAQDSQGFQTFVQDLDAVITNLANNDNNITGTLHNLSGAVTQIATFVQNNRNNLGATFQNLSVFAGTLQQEQGQLAQAIKTTPLTLGDFANAVDPNAPGGPAVRARLNTSPSTTAITQQVCGNFDNGYGSALLRALRATVGDNPMPAQGAYPLSQFSTLDVLCAFSSTFQALGPAKGSAGPNLSLTALAP